MQKQKHHILIVDDDIRILDLLSRFFVKNGFIVSDAHNVEEAKKYLGYFIFDLILLDVMIPGVTGIEFAREIKSQNTEIPVILLTALSETENKIEGLKSKADDYITKPFNPEEMLLRCNNLMRLYKKRKNEFRHVLIGDKFYYDIEQCTLFCNHMPVFLTISEKELLEILIRNRGRMMTRENLAELMKFAEVRSVDVQISRLRNKIEDDKKNPRYIQTIRQQGYILRI